MGTASADAGEKSVRYGGKDYATIDFIAPGTIAVGMQHAYLEVPRGWVLAEKSEGVVENVVAKFPWGTRYLVFRDGGLYGTKNATLAGRLVACQQLNRKDDGYLPARANCRVLICAEGSESAEPAVDGDHCAQAMARLWETREFADCEVVCNGHVFQCHRAVLAQASPVFKQMLSGEMLEAKAQRIRLEALETETEAASAFLEFVYTGLLDCKSKHFPTVVKLADFYQLDCITAKACNGMLEALDEGNVVPIARLLKSVRKKPRVGPYWTKLADKVQQSKELATAVLSEL